MHSSSIVLLIPWWFFRYRNRTVLVRGWWKCSVCPSGGYLLVKIYPYGRTPMDILMSIFIHLLSICVFLGTCKRVSVRGFLQLISIGVHLSVGLSVICFSVHRLARLTFRPSALWSVYKMIKCPSARAFVHAIPMCIVSMLAGVPLNGGGNYKRPKNKEKKEKESFVHTLWSA